MNKLSEFLSFYPQYQIVSTDIPGIVVTSMNKGRTWKVTHKASGNCITNRSWPTPELAIKAAHNCLCGVDWTVDRKELVMSEEVKAARNKLQHEPL